MYDKPVPTAYIAVGAKMKDYDLQYSEWIRTLSDKIVNILESKWV
jgi:hypothetical protein